MKKYTFLLILICLAYRSFGITTDTLPPLSKQDYLMKSKQQKTTAKILVGAGALLTGVGMLVGTGQALGNIFVPEPERRNSGEVIIIIVLVTMGSSIPFFISSSSNKKKAMQLSLKAEKTSVVAYRSINNKLIPSLTLKLSL